MKPDATNSIAILPGSVRLEPTSVMSCTPVSTALRLAVFAALISFGCTCTLETCGSGETLFVTWTSPADPLDGYEVGLCRNDACWRGALTGVASPQSVRLVAETAPNQAPPSGIIPSLYFDASASVITFTGIFQISAAEDVKAGNVLSVRVFDSAGAEVFGKMGRVAGFSESEPDCADYRCRNATVDLRGISSN